MIHSSLALLGAALVAASPGAPAAARRVAVLDFNARWAPGCATARTDAEQEKCEVLRLFADKARGGALAVLRPPAYVVMTRENTAQILKDMGGVCSEGECEVETARLLGASIVVSGEVSLVEGTYIVSLKVHDVTSAALLGTADTQAKTKLEAFGSIRAETERMLKEAVGLDGTAPVAVRPPAPPPPAKKVETDGVLALDVADENALVIVDGQEIGKGPLKLERKVLEGTHRLVVAKEGHATFEQAYRVEAGGKVKAAPRLVALPRQVPVAPPAAPAPATAAAQRDVSARGPQWWAEAGPLVGLRVNLPPHSNIADGKINSAPRALARVGWRKSDRFAFEGVLGWFEANWQAKNATGPETEDWEFESYLVGGGASWAPNGNRYFSLGADVGAAITHYKLEPGTYNTTNGQTPFVLLEARADYPLGAFAVGLRVGFLWTSPPKASYQWSGGGEMHVDAGELTTFPASLVAQYRF